MLTWKEYFKKSGGLKLIWQYMRAGVLSTAVLQFILLGRSRKALELLRLAVELKTQQQLKKEYARDLDCATIEHSKELEHCAIKCIWICWWQGINEAPPLVQHCYQSVCEYMKDWEITVITLQNYQDYVSFPPHIIEKWRAGKISLTHLSDLLRLELLLRYGGLWMDATVFCTGNNVPQCILDSDLFVYQMLKPGADGHSSLLSNWFIYARSNNCLLRMTRTLLYSYWKKNDRVTDYFIFHHFFSIASERFPDVHRSIPQICNSTPHILLLNLFEPYSSTYMADLCRMTCFHKLSYKFDKKQMTEKGTYYDILFN